MKCSFLFCILYFLLEKNILKYSLASESSRLNFFAHESREINKVNDEERQEHQIFHFEAQASTTPNYVYAVAGNGEANFNGDGGDAKLASLNSPFDVFAAEDGQVYIADNNNNRIRRINNNGIISTFAGTTSGFSGDGRPAISSKLNLPRAVIGDTNGVIYISDTLNHRIRSVATDGIINTFAGGGIDTTSISVLASSATLVAPRGMFIDTAGRLYFAESVGDTIRRIDLFSTIMTVVAGQINNGGTFGDGGQATDAQMDAPVGVYVDTLGVMYVTESNNGVVRRVDTAGIISTIAGGFGITSFSGDGGQASNARFNRPTGIWGDTQGNLYISDSNNNRIRRISGSTNIISTVIGNQFILFNGYGLLGTSTSTNRPRGLRVNGSEVYYSEAGLNRVRVSLPVAPSAAPTLIPTSAPTAEPTLAPSSVPTLTPSSEPSAAPTLIPTAIPSFSPTLSPSSTPSGAPTSSPTTSPSMVPTFAPSTVPTIAPSFSPSSDPTTAPSTSDTVAPTTAPTYSPTVGPSVGPSKAPTFKPTALPTVVPTAKPTDSPSSTPTNVPTGIPSRAPSEAPTVVPSETPTAAPTALPSVVPSESPTGTPTAIPSAAPTTSPTDTPSSHPSTSPSVAPSSAPSIGPTATPSSIPTGVPTAVPSLAPTEFPSAVPTQRPSAPTVVPSRSPSALPTSMPTACPSGSPTFSPTAAPTVVPSTVPTASPTGGPTATPTNPPTFMPSFSPSLSPSAGPSAVPTLAPTAAPSGIPTAVPSALPSALPTSAPSAAPSSSPTTSPTVSPSSLPTAVPTSAPSGAPSAKPSTSPSEVPTSGPSDAPMLRPSSAPTVAPTRSPSALPTANPTVRIPDLESVPKISSISITPSSNSIEITLTYKVLDYGGFFYCQAFSAGFTPTSVSQIQSSGFNTAYTVDSTTTVVLLTGLIATNTYDVYCYAQNRFTNGYDLAEVISTKQVVTTLCCIVPTFENAPRFVYGDSNVYAGGSTTQYVFSYSIPAAPKEALTITPTFTAADGSVISSDVLMTAPAFNSFTSSSRLTTSFIVAASDSFSGDAILTLKLTGADSPNFEETSVEVSILSSQATLPPPVLSQARFSDAGINLFLIFDASTDKAKMTSRFWSCSALFEFTTAEESICSWVNSTTVRAQLSLVHDTVLYTGDTVVVKGGLVKARCLTGINCDAYVALERNNITTTAPLNPITPTVVLKVSPLVSPCSNLTIDATLSQGATGRPWRSVSWQVSSLENADLSELANFLATHGQDVTRQFVVPSSLLGTEPVTFSLALENFWLNTGFSAATTVVSSNLGTPQIFIRGGSEVTITPDEVLSVSVGTSKSGCSSPALFSYQWTLLQGGGTPVSVVSTSNNPKIFKLPSYSLPVDTYTLQITVTVPASATAAAVTLSQEISVTVDNGAVEAVIKGARDGAVAVEEFLLLDGSESQDMNYPSAAESELTYQWDCLVVSSSNVEEFGSDCSSVFNSSVDSVSVTIPKTSLELNTSYTVTLTATAPDGRYGETTVTFERALEGAPVVEISRTGPSKINSGDQFVVNGFNRASYSVSAQWSVWVDGDELALEALTKTQRTFSAAQALNTISFPLVLVAEYTPGSIVTFRLYSASSSVSSLFAYSEVSVEINTAPMGGVFSVTPESGIALETVFNFLSTGWLDDAEDLPLSYAFSYHTLTIDRALTVQFQSTSNTAESELAPGLESLDRKVTTNCFIYDILSAKTLTSVQVEVLESESSAAVASYLSSSLELLNDEFDADLYSQVISNSAVTVNNVDCSLANASYCATRNRGVCSTVSNTCTNCLSGYVGVVGASNTFCFDSEDADLGATGSSCASDSQCLYGLCSNSTCVEPTISCPSSSADSECSGRGLCEYSDSNGLVLEEPCLLSQVSCSARCLCEEGYGGSDCSLDATEVADRDSIRTSLCGAIVSLSDSSEPSAELLSSLTSSLLSSYSASEVVSTNSSKCTEALSVIASFTAEGLLVDTSAESLAPVGELLSNFMDGVKSAAVSGDAVVASINDVLNGIQAALQSGQGASEIVSDNLRISVRNEFTEDLSGSSLTVPLSESDKTYGSSRQGIQFVGDNAKYCASEDGYVQMSLLMYGANPYPNSTDLDSGLLQLQTTSFSSSASASFVVTSEPAYFINLQFTQEQDFNFNVSMEAILSGETNETLPQCTLRVGDTYVPCGNCNISSYSNKNVTYACYDVRDICPPATARKLTHRGGSYYKSTRVLQDLGDDTPDEAVADGSAVSQFSTLFQGFRAELTSVLSSNPFNLDVEEAKGVLIFLGTFVLIILATAFLMRRWDIIDHDYVIYAKVEAELKLVEMKKYTEERMRAKNEKLNNITLKLSRSKSMMKSSSKSFTRINSGSIFKGSGSDESLVKQGRGLEKLKRVSKKESLRLEKERKQNKVSFREALLVAFSFTRQVAPSALKEQMLQQVFSRHIEYGTVKDQMVVFEEGLVAEKVTGYLDNVMQTDFLLLKTRQVTKMIQSLLSNHDYLKMFFESSLYESRLVRWVGICMKVLVVIFIDTLFYSSYYPDDGMCEALSRRQDCVNEINSASNDRKCEWNPNEDGVGGGTCSPVPPPDDAITAVLVSMMCVIVAAPLIFLYDFIIYKYASKRPRVEEYGWNRDYWLGRSTNVRTGTVSAISPLDDIREDATKRKQALKDAKGELPTVMTTKKPTVTPTKEEVVDDVAMKVYHNFLSPKEELQYILRRMQNFCDRYLQFRLIQDAPAKEVVSNKATAKAITDLGVRVDGSAMALSLRQLFFYGDEYHHLKGKLTVVRSQVKRLVEILENMGQVDAKSKDIALLQFFILEQFTSFKRYALRSQIFSLADSTPESIAPMAWLASWVFLLFSGLFYLYWILAWGVSNGGMAFESWGNNIVIAVIQDLFFIQVVKVYVIYVLSMVSIRPQLKYIYGVLHRMSMAYVQGDLDEIKQEFRVVQHFSPACRVANLNVANNLAAAKILRHVDDADVVVCRTNRDMKLAIIATTIIAVPLMATAITPALADVSLDIALPAMTSTFLLFMIYLFSISILALVLPYLCLGVLYYVRFKLFPKTNSNENDTINGMKQGSMKFSTSSSFRISQSFALSNDSDIIDQATSASIVRRARHQTKSWREQTRDFFESLRVITANFVLSAGNFFAPKNIFAWLSGTDPEMKLVQSTAWTSMNLPLDYQSRDNRKEAHTVIIAKAFYGLDPDDFMKIGHQGPLNLQISGENVHALQVFSTPLPKRITELRSGDWSIHALGKKKTEDVKKSYVMQTLENKLGKSRLFQVPAHVDVRVPVEPREKTEQFMSFQRKYLIITDIEVAWREICIRYFNEIPNCPWKQIHDFLRPESFNESYDSEDSQSPSRLEQREENLVLYKQALAEKVPVTDLSKVVENVWDWFQPGGTALTGAEMEEIIALFWVYADEELDGSNSSISIGESEAVSSIRLSEFKQWFFNVVDKLLLARGFTLPKDMWLVEPTVALKEVEDDNKKEVDEEVVEVEGSDASDISDLVADDDSVAILQMASADDDDAGENMKNDIDDDDDGNNNDKADLSLSFIERLNRVNSLKFDDFIDGKYQIVDEKAVSFFDLLDKVHDKKFNDFLEGKYSDREVKNKLSG